MNTSKRRGRVNKNVFTTRSGKTVKVNQSLGQKVKGMKDTKALRKAERMSGLPKSRAKRFFYRLHPKRLAAYWFSREGGIMALKLMGIAFIAGFITLAGLFAYFRKDLPDLRNDISGNNIGGSIRYYDRTGKTLLFEDYDAVKRIPVEDEGINAYMKNATIAIEDKDFFKHGGFDVRGIMRAGVSNVIGGSGGQQGGSTITQQLVKLSQDWTKDQTYTRKIKEIILAVELERTYSKQEILVGYLNAAPYGGIEYGVEAASRGYFDKQAKDLTLDEAAMFAAIPKSPSFYSPYSANFDKAEFVGRQHYIIDQMYAQGMISSEERDAAKKIDTVKKVKPRKPKYDGIISPWFVLAAKEQLEETRGKDAVLRSGWKVTTTLDMNLQKTAEQKVNEGMAQVRRQGGDTAGFAATDVKTGQMVALVGGSDFTNKEFGQNNYARLRLPPGSSFKPYDYAALIENTENSGAGSVLYDTQGPLEGYPCTNKARPQNGGNCLYDYDFRYPGATTLRYALGGSRNVPAVKAMLTAGVDKTIQTAEKLGLKSGYKCYGDETLTEESQCYASSAIGDGAYLRLDEHVHAYGSLSRNGVNLPQTYILKIEDSKGKVVDEWKPTKGEQALKPETAYIVSDILSDPKASYFTTKAHSFNGHKYSLKTGTTNDTKDGWLMGYSTYYSAGVWVGYHTRRVEMSGFMETMTRPIWKGWMDEAHKDLQPKEREKPAGIQTKQAYVMRSKAGGGQIMPSPSQDLFPAWYKNNRRSSNVKQVIDQVSNKLATECTPQRARKETNDALADSFSSDIFVGTGGRNTTSGEKDDVHKCNDKKPGISLSVQKSGNNYNLVASVTQGTHPLSSDKFKGQVTFTANGKQLAGGSYEISSPGAVVYKNYKPSGSVTITATVVDSVLYDATDSETVSGQSAGISNFTITNEFGNNVTLSWSAYSGATGYTVTKSSSGICNVSGTTATCNNSPNGTSFTVTANGVSGSPSATISRGDD
jgi:membrane peptidoglycan carboxypeptidase